MIRFSTLTIIFVFACGCQDPAEKLLKKFPRQQDPVKTNSVGTLVWASRLPVSLNEQVPPRLKKYGELDFDPDFVKKYWHDCEVEFYALGRFQISKYFEPPQERLCRAIYRRDIDEMKELIESGVDVNASKYPGCTLLYIAFNISDDPRPFELLLKSGADPNRSSSPQSSTWLPVSYLVATSSYNRLFQFVFENGGDPNQIVKWGSDQDKFATPLSRTVLSDSVDCIERLKLLIKKGGKLAETGIPSGSELVAMALRNSIGDPPCSELDCQKSLILLEAGASFSGRTIQDRADPFYGHHVRPIHLLAFYDEEVSQRPETEQEHFEKLLLWLINHGESLEQGKADLQSWEAERIAKGKQTIRQLEQDSRADARPQAQDSGKRN